MLKAVLFDMDGTMVDTEDKGHRPAFNAAFREFGLPYAWDTETYKSLVSIGGGKERISNFLSGVMPEKAKEKDFKDWVAAIHRKKTELFLEQIRTNQMTPRPGIIRLIDEILKNGIKVGICSTSQEDTVRSIALKALGKERMSRISLLLAGDVVSKKKPDPEIYNLAIERLGIHPDEGLVIEDSRIGLLSSLNAGIKCLVTANTYTEGQDFTGASLVVSCLGDSDGEKPDIVLNPFSIDVPEVVDLYVLEQISRITG